MPGRIFEHNNVLALGEETFTGSKLAITIPSLNDKILYVRGRLMDVDTGAEAAASLQVTETIASDGKSFNLFVWDAAGAAAAVSRRVQWFAIVQ